MRKRFVRDVTVVDGTVLINVGSWTMESFVEIMWNNFLDEKDVCRGCDCD